MKKLLDTRQKAIKRRFLRKTVLVKKKLKSYQKEVLFAYEFAKNPFNLEIHFSFDDNDTL